MYAGKWCNDKTHEKGAHICASGARYAGQFRDGIHEGQGKYMYAGRDECIGELKAGHVDGHCKYIVSESDTFLSVEGTWKDHYFKNGVINYADGNEYEGSCMVDLSKWNRKGTSKMIFITSLQWKGYGEMIYL